MNAVAIQMQELTSRCFLLLLLLNLHGVVRAQTRHDAYIHLTTGDSLDATYYVPPQLPPLNGYPGIIFVHGYGFDKNSVSATCSTYALGGYLTLCFSVRGHGNSSGASTIMSTRERIDFQETINWFKALPSLDTSSIGVSGGSQGGLHGLWAAADRLPVKAITADVIVPHWASDMLSNGSIRRTALLLMKSNGVRYDERRDSLWNLVRTDNYDSLLSQFSSGRDIDTTQLNSSTIPLLQLLKWQDHYFAANDGIASFDRYAGPRKIYVGARGHFSDQVESERVYQYDQVTRWLNYFLRGQQNGIVADPMYTYANSALPMDTSGFFQWTRTETSTSPAAGLQLLRCNLNTDSTISFTSHINLRDSLTLYNRYFNPSYNFDTAWVEGFRGPRFDAALPKHTLVFTSPPLDNDVMWIGVPKMHLFVRSNDTKFPLHVHIYELDSAGNRYFINRINCTARNWTPGTEGVIDVDGTPHSHQFKRGNRIRFEITNVDVTNRQLLGSYPFVVPVFADVSATILLDSSHQSYIGLPLIGTPTSVGSAVSRLPMSAELFQNYPNPFNPATNLSFVISARDGSASGGGNSSFVSLKIYDLLGREVVTIVNGILQSGRHTVLWDASKYAAGIYFYRLEAGRSVEVKKMVVVK